MWENRVNSVIDLRFHFTSGKCSTGNHSYPYHDAASTVFGSWAVLFLLQTFLFTSFQYKSWFHRHAYFLEVFLTSVDAAEGIFIAKERILQSSTGFFSGLPDLLMLSSPVLSFFLIMHQSVNLSTLEVLLSRLQISCFLFPVPSSTLTYIEISLNFIFVAPLKQLPNVNSIPKITSRTLICIICL